VADLAHFEGRDVLRSTVAIRNTGDGLSEAMAVEPQEYHQGDRLYVVLECDVEKLRFDPIKGTDALTRVHMLKAGNAAVVDAALVAEALRLQAEKIRRAREQADGVQRIVLDNEQIEALRMEHTEEGHDLPIFGCPLCSGDEPDPADVEPRSIGDQ
jgi:hypothetical protein